MASTQIEIEDDVARVRIDDGKANAFGMELIGELHDALDRAMSDAKAVVFLGRPGRFSAGFDLRVMQTDPDAAAGLVTAGGKLFLRIFEHPQPVIAGCTGHALAAGAIFLTACDTRIGAVGEFKIGLNETAIGMTLPDFGIHLPRARLAPQHYTRAVIQAEIYDPVGAAQAGFLDTVVEPEALEDAAMEAAHALKLLPGAAYAGNKRKIREPVIEAVRSSF